ncbi:PH domain-containing protein [Sphaerisporangium fuscum]|uniref:PH domain-containing protein n=1 Tax=Sphaerisporangium fuscum TaxID=2835868 RepID=UPI001BDCA86E|nr:PH domain-containing protein [Sphaerisporangium fuscum]
MSEYLADRSANVKETAAAPWRGLDPRTIAVHCSWLAAPLGSLALTAAASGGRLGPGEWITVASIGVAFSVVTALGLVRLARTRYRVTEDAFEVRTGLFVRRYRSVPLNRIRGVDLTANPVHRLFGLAVLRAGTGGGPGSGSGELALEALSRPAAERLRAELLSRAGVAASADPVVSVLDPRWTRYAPLTFWVFGGVFVVIGTAYRILHDLGVEPWRIPVVRRALLTLGGVSPWTVVPVSVALIAVVGSVGAVVLYVENWWRFRLEWTDSGTLAVRRGLLTTRSVSIERARLRGLVLREPLLLRAAGGATLKAVAGGLGDADENRRRSALLPPAPRAEALRAAARVLAGPGSAPEPRLTASPLDAPRLSPLDRPRLTAHPAAAFRRRVLRGMIFVVLPVTAALAVPGVLFTTVLVHCAWVFLLVGTLTTFWLARDAYRALGHGLDGPYLVTRSGTFSRDTVALRRDGIVAWTFSSSPFARRAGLVTLTAAVAAGENGYRVPDMAERESARLAETATPGILTEFLERA